MTEAPVDHGLMPDEAEPRGLSLEVIGAGVTFCAGMAAAASTAFLRQEPPSLMLLVGWPVLALGAGVVLDQRPGSTVGRVMALLALSPLLDLGLSLVRHGPPLSSADIVRAVADLVALHVALLVGLLIWSVRPTARRGATYAAAAGCLAASALVAAGAGTAGWPVLVASLVGLSAVQLRDARADGRVARRRLALLAATFAVGGSLVGAAAVTSSAEVAGYVACSVLVLTVVAVAGLTLAEELRPLDEDLLDVAVVVGAFAVAALAAGLVWAGSGVIKLTSPRTSAAFAAAVTLALAVPGGVLSRRAVLTRRYGNGVIAPSDVAAITADLHAQTEPRDLLEKAARMVAAASGSRDARIVLGDDELPTLEGWVTHPLVVGGDQVGALLIDGGGAEGPEQRQARVVDQLLPTVSLVTRAVGLAVEAEHARRDVSRERDAERSRILTDLHDGLGPSLAGMSMRVGATLRSNPPDEVAALLADLADGLAASRTDLRRLVSGLTPSALDDRDLGGALRGLVSSFQAHDDGPLVLLSTDLDQGAPLTADAQVTVYRCVAEGLTNALRHASAEHIAVVVTREPPGVVAEVLDDGVGGLVVPGVGLSSLAARAAQAGGTLEITTNHPQGTRVRVELPA